MHIIDSGGLYGAEMVLLNLAKEQARRGDFAVLASIGSRFEREKPLEVEAARQGVTCIPFRFRNGPNILWAWRILRYARVEGFDIIHSHGYKANILLGFMPRKIRRIPLVTTLHGWTSIDRLSKLKLYEWVDKKSLRFIDRVVVVSRAMLPLLNGYPRENHKVQVINNGLSYVVPSREKNIDPKIKSFCSEGFILGSIARLSHEKGHMFLLEAMDKLLLDGMDVRLVLIGDGPDRAALEKQIGEQGLQERVLLPGYKEDAKSYMFLFDVFVLPSLTEGLPITLLEAMQTGTPVVATKVGGVPEALEGGGAGMLVAPRDSKGLAEAIKALYVDPDLGNRLAEKAKTVFTNKYSSQRMAEQYEMVYESAIHFRAEKFRRDIS